MSINAVDVVMVVTPRDSRSFRDARQQPHLGFAFIGGHLAREGISCHIVDAYTFDQPIDSVIDEVAALRPRLVGFYSCSEDRYNAIALIKGIKAASPETLTVGGGPHFGYAPVDALEQIPELDFAIAGDGEEAMLELWNGIQTEGGKWDLSNVAGLSWRSDGLIIMNERRVTAPDFEGMKPAWELYDMDRYDGALTLTIHTRSIGVISSRGCPAHCTFCANSLNRNVRYKKPSTFVDECQEVIERYGFEGLNIQDDSFTENYPHVRAVCREIIDRGLRFKWYCSLRVNDVERETLEIMKEAGCVGLGFGVESCSNEVLRRVAKGTNREMIFDAVDMVNSVGFDHIGLFVMTSLPGENKEAFLESQHYLNELYAKVRPGWTRQPVLGSITLVYPGTPMERQAKNNGVIPEDFSWNAPYTNPKAEIFGTNPFLPYYENDGWPIEDIKKTVDEEFPGCEIYIC